MKLAARLLLVFAFVFAQAGGVAHDAWHSSTELGTDSKAPKKNALCDFHTALGSVLGALDSAAPHPEVEAQKQICLAGVESRPARFSLLASRSRGPPTLL